MVLDSGVGRTAVDAQTAEAVGLQNQGTLVATGVAGDGTAFLAGPALLSFAGIQVPLQSLTVLDLGPLNAATNGAASVVLGEDLFDFVTVEFDFRASRVLISKSGARLDHASFVRAPLLLGKHHRRHMPFRVGSDLQLQGMVDLGSDAPLYLSQEVVSAFKLVMGRPHSLAESIGAEGASVDTVFSLPSITLGGQELRSVPVRVPETWTVSVPAVIGLPLLARYFVSFCFAENLIALRADTVAITKPFDKDRSGIGAIMKNGHLRIAFVSPNSPASQLGLRAGDEILTINGVAVQKVLRGANRPLGFGSEGTLFDLGLAGGRQVGLVLADYY